MAFANDWKSFRILKESIGVYGADLVIDTPNPYPEVPQKNYIEAARKLGKVNATDPATTVDYEVEIEAIGCSTNEKTVQLDSTLSLPTDPYLAYWAVAPENRVQKAWRSVSARVNPCADSEIADLPSPEYYWYFFDPYAQGCDINAIKKTIFDVRLQLTEGTPLSGQVQIDHESLRKLDEIQIGLVFGYVVHDEQYTELNKVASAIESNASWSGPELSSWDSSSAQFVWLWNKLDSFLQIESKTVSVSDGSLLLRASGHFKNTGQKFSLRAYLGPTDLYGPVPVKHWSHTLQSMLKSDIFIYAGHSGLGENLRVSRIVDQPIPLESLTAAPKYQILAYLSCYSYTYFDQGVFPSHPWRLSRERADLFLTGGMTYEFGQASLGVLKTIDRAMANQSAPRLKDFFPGDAFIVFRSFQNKDSNSYLKSEERKPATTPVVRKKDRLNISS
ncbi:MAG: hypothetical protein K2X47_12045 [Bdellovibrionales bacterium]|nr:hypothetical protein [Bdellovibrionales bacterium]